MKAFFSFILSILLFSSCQQPVMEYHVSKSGDNGNNGSVDAPFLTIGKAAEMAMPGDVITVHEGMYREEVNPPRGGTSDKRRITYRAAPGETVEIRGSEIVTGWTEKQNGVWITEVDNGIFGDFNPFADEVQGDWFNPMGRKHHTGCVYIDGEWLFEAATEEDLEKPGGKTWYAIVGDSTTLVMANFGEMDPNKHLTEINVRQTVFYPRKPFVNYITVKGFNMRHAAPPWAPPTAEQMGLIGTHWSKGWIIEDNEISHSINAGITLGKYGDEFDNLAPTAEAYLHSIDRARQHGWNRDSVGSHIVRNNEISWCEQAGMVGSMGASFSQVTGNYIHHIHTQRRFGGAEMAAIKFHAPIDMLIKDNRIHDGFMGIWLDWMTQGTRVTGNLLYRNTAHDIYLEVNHGPFVIDNNICLSDNCRHLSQGGAYVHNLFAGKWGNWDNGRSTPYFKPHSTEKVGDHDLFVGDDRFYNNLFIGNGGQSLYITETTNEGVPFYFSYGLECYEYRPQLPETAGNVYYHGARPCSGEQAVIIAEDPALNLVEWGDTVYLEFSISKEQDRINTQLVTSELLGKATVPDAPFEDYDGTGLVIDTDYFGEKRNTGQPVPGPFENMKEGLNRMRVWPK
jgi:alpha-N-arabinofuranosidase